MFQGMEYVYEVYKERSFSKAARNLFISQPSLSANIKRIEKRLCYPLFDRSTKPLGLTECGKQYIRAVEKMMEAQTEFSDFLNDWGELKTGTIVLGGSSLFSSWVLPQLMGAFTRAYPLVKIDLVEESTGKLETLLQNGSVDLVLDNCDLDLTVFERCIYQEEHLLLAVPRLFDANLPLYAYQIRADEIRSRAYLEKDVPIVPLEVFRDCPFVMLKPENDTRKRGMEICQEQQFHPNIAFELDQQQTAYHITCSGLGISFVSDTLIDKCVDNPNVVYYKLGDKYSCRNLYFYWKKGRYVSRAMEEFLKMVL